MLVEFLSIFPLPYLQICALELEEHVMYELFCF
jgi:hypothetical protein